MLLPAVGGEMQRRTQVLIAGIDELRVIIQEQADFLDVSLLGRSMDRISRSVRGNQGKTRARVTSSDRKDMTDSLVIPESVCHPPAGLAIDR
jgi:hypothetical protein